MKPEPYAPEWFPEFARCEQWISAALEYCGGTHKIEDIIAGIYTGQFQFWPGEKSAVITEIVEHPQMRVLHFFLVGGDLAELAEMEPVMVAWGRRMGCERATTIGREGWRRTFLKDRGYRPMWHVMARNLLEG